MLRIQIIKKFLVSVSTNCVYKYNGAPSYILNEQAGFITNI